MSKSLSNIGILVTRAAHQQTDIESLIEDGGGIPYSVPLIKIDSPESWEHTDAAISELDSFDWIIFTSVNGVDGFLDRLKQSGRKISSMSPNKIAVVGSKTRSRLESFGVEVTLQPKIFDGDNLLESLKKDDITGKRILFPGAEYGRENLISGLTDIGANVLSVPVYRTIPNDDVDSSKLISLFEDGVIQIATFFSPSTFRVFLSHLPIKITENTINKSVAIAVIGTTTSKYVNGLGFKADIIPEEHTAFGLIEAMKNWAISTKSQKMNEQH